MKYRIVGDSCLDLTEELRNMDNLTIVPLVLQVDGVDYVDDSSFDQKRFLRAVAESAECPKSSCPSPESFKEAYGDDDTAVFGVTLSAELSGSYNSAMIGRQLALEEHPDKKIHIFNSRSASVGQTLIAMNIVECAKAGCDFEETVEKVEAYIDKQQTMFVLENLETLRKNGRLTGVKATLVSVLNIKPVMIATPRGTIDQKSLGRGMKKAVMKMAEEVGGLVKDTEDRVFGIAHCNCYERAITLKKEILKRYHFRDVIIVNTAGVSTMYANDGGVIVAF